MNIYSHIKYLVMIVWLLPLCFVNYCYAQNKNQEYLYLGVLAKLGKEECFEQWYPTALYLREKLPGFKTQVLCLDFSEIDEVVEKQRVDFVIANPSIYVNLEYNFGATRIATLRNKRSDNSSTQLGGVIFHRSDRTDIASVTDLKGKRFMAVAENSFGGWYVSHRYLVEKGFDPLEDFKELVYGERHDSVVMSVINGVVDAGSVRTDTLERMAWESKIDLNDITIIGKKEDHTDFIFARTTRLYPEWALAKTKHTSEELAKLVALAMMQMPIDSKAALSSQSMGWTIPMDYHEVHECLRELRAPPYEEYGQISLKDLYSQYKVYLYIVSIFTLCTLCGGTLTIIINRKLATALEDLDTEHKQRALVVADLNEFKMTLEQTLDCVFMFSPDTLRFFYANQGAIDQIGYQRDEIMSMTPLDIEPDFSEEQYREMILPLIEDKQTSLTFTTNHERKDSTLIPVEVFLRYIKPPQKHGRFVAVVRDITLQKQQEQENKLLQTKLLHEQKLASVGSLAAGIAHEINTPAQYLGSNIDFLEDAFSDINDTVSTIEKVIENAENAENDEIERILQPTKNKLDEIDWDYLKEEVPNAIEQSSDGVKQVSSIVLAMKNFAHPGGTEKEMTNLNELLKTTLTVSRSEWKHHVEIGEKFSPDLPPVPCVRNEISQVFLNLIVNGAHSIEEKLESKNEVGKGNITLTTELQGDMVSISITDSGCGIPNEHLEKIFDPFFTTKEVGKGTGQGLTIAYDIITNKHQGVMEVQSTVGEGSTFTLKLPTQEILHANEQG